MKIGLDAMGGDDAPRETVAGAILAAREFGVEMVLVGQEDKIRAELAKQDTAGLKITVQQASEVIPKPTIDVPKK